MKIYWILKQALFLNKYLRMRSDNITPHHPTISVNNTERNDVAEVGANSENVKVVVAGLVWGAVSAEACQVPWLVLMYQLACGRASVSSRQRFKIKLLFMQLTSRERKPK